MNRMVTGYLCHSNLNGPTKGAYRCKKFRRKLTNKAKHSEISRGTDGGYEVCSYRMNSIRITNTDKL